jgi:hypothetical protein
MAKSSIENTARDGAVEPYKPEQLLMFELTGDDVSNYSNTIELYDVIPKYVTSAAAAGEQLLKREFKHRGETYTAVITPATLQQVDGTIRVVYPSQREELIEDALRKLVAEGKGLFHEGEAAVVFTLYELREELARRGHTYSIREIKEGLLVLSKTNLELKREGGEVLYVSNLFPQMALRTSEQWKHMGKASKPSLVKFHPLVTQSIVQLRFRQLNYAKSMNLRFVIARRLFKRMSHHYVQASFYERYTIGLRVMIRDFGLTEYADIRNNLREARKALDELKAQRVIEEYAIERVMDRDNRRKLYDALFTITPHSDFVADIVAANRRHKAQSALPQRVK